MLTLPASSQELVDVLRLIRSENIGIKTFRSLVEFYGSASKTLRHIPELAARGGSKRPIQLCSADKAEDESAKYGAKLLTYLDPHYPKLLSQITDAPPVISVLGNIEILNRPAAAIIGARNASLNGKIFAKKIAENLLNNDFTVFSGQARGIDSAAHESAINSTIAVIAGGIDNIYPPENTKLYHKIAENGAIIAELPIGTAPQSRHFPQRNRIISGLSIASIIIEAGLKSGSLITARMAAEQNREVFAVPGFSLDPRSQGCNRLIKEGAYLVDNQSTKLR